MITDFMKDPGTFYTDPNYRNRQFPKIACLCPTYKRHNKLKNAVACFLNQIYPEDCCQMFVLDDAGELTGDVICHDRFPKVLIKSMNERIPFDLGLPEKYNLLMKMTEEYEPDITVIWEDDDVFLPWHLISIATQWFHFGVDWFRTKMVYSNYGRKYLGDINLEPATGRFHSSWAFTSHIVSKYPKTSKLDFDQQFGQLLRKTTQDPKDKHELNILPSYIYRWGNAEYHGSAHGEQGYKNLWESLEYIKKIDPPVNLIPELDEETRTIYNIMQPGTEMWKKFLEATCEVGLFDFYNKTATTHLLNKSYDIIAERMQGNNPIGKCGTFSLV